MCAFFRTYGGSGEEKTAYSDFMPSSPFMGHDIINVGFDGDMMSVALASGTTISSLKGVLYENTFVPPAMQRIFACGIGSTPLELSDFDEVGMVPTSKPLSMVMAGETPSC
ncbi:hypothetical protein T492DRAFT_1149666 [Pavlovales sp. CCMP2436]|nr:hypothetical protein T492DRAFT_1149666 [Pavlovales sp. CCMP2436]